MKRVRFLFTLLLVSMILFSALQLTGNRGGSTLSLVYEIIKGPLKINESPNESLATHPTLSDHSSQAPSSTPQFRMTQYRLSDRYLILHPLDGSDGRLGNFCFRYAAALAIADINGMRLILPDTKFVHQMKQIFPNIKAPLISEIPFSSQLKFRTIGEKNWGMYDSVYEKLPPENVNLTYVYAQSWKYFTKVEPNVRNELQIRPDIGAKAKSFIQELKNKTKAAHVIGVHVRRGDFLEKRYKQFGYAVAPKEFFISTFDWYIKHYGSEIVFLIASDDLRWCKTFLHLYSSKIIYSEDSDVTTDFARLIASDHHIVSVGSFGWWTAWLGKGDVLYYKDFPTPGSKHKNHHKSADYYPPNWIAFPQ